MWPLLYRLSSSDWGTWTSTVSAPEASMATAGISGGIPPASMGDPTECRAESLNLVGGDSPNVERVGALMGCLPL